MGEVVGVVPEEKTLESPELAPVALQCPEEYEVAPSVVRYCLR